MRVLSLLTASIAVLSACSTAPTNHTVLTSGNLDFARVQSAFRAPEVSAISHEAKVTLENVNFQTPRQIERDLTMVSAETWAPVEVVEVEAVKAAETLFPGIELKLISIDSTNSFHYASFQQTLRGRDIVGARLQLRLLPSGEWVTANSNLVASHLLSNLEISATWASRRISSAEFFPQPHQILKEKSVVYPRSEDDGSLSVLAAREFSIFDLNNQLEFIFWVDESNLNIISGFQPSGHVDSLRLRGSIVPNAPEDATTEVFFPFATMLAEGGEKAQADSEGSFKVLNPLRGNAQVKLENEFIVVVNNERGKSTLDVNLESLTETELSIDAGPILEERNIYHWIMTTKKFLKDKFNFTKQSTQLTAIARFGEDLDNAFFMPLTYSLSFGSGKKVLKNTALSRDIIIHEFGHSIVYEKFGLVGGYEFSAMNEAMSDFLAATVTNDPQIAEGAMQPRTEMPYLRTVENKMRYPQNYSGDGFHVDGQIFSGALWDIRKALGADIADSLIHEAQMAAPKSIFEFYRELLKIDELKDDRNPYTPSKNEAVIRRAFFRRGIGSMDVRFTQSAPKDLTEPWKPGCWSMAHR